MPSLQVVLAHAVTLFSLKTSIRRRKITGMKKRKRYLGHGSGSGGIERAKKARGRGSNAGGIIINFVVIIEDCGVEYVSRCRRSTGASL
jgi:hypothetical protein